MTRSPETYLKLLISLRTKNGPRSMAGAIRADRLDAIAARMATDNVQPNEHEVNEWLAPFRTYYGANWHTSAEVEQNILIAQREKNAARRKPNDKDVTRETLKKMSAVERLDYANAKSDVPKPTIYRIENENFATGNEK